MSRIRAIFIERITSESRSYRRPSGPLWQPAVDIYRCPGGWKVKLDLAGIKLEDVEVLVVEPDKLVVRGVRRDSFMDEGWSYHQMEITYSRFERVLKMPFDLRCTEIRTEYADGFVVLHLDTK